jgi:hypothetical protein
LAVAVGCSVLSAWCWARRTAVGVIPRVATMSGVDNPATAHNRMISRSGVDSVVLSARRRAHWPGSIDRSLCSRASGGAGGGKAGGGANDVPVQGSAIAGTGRCTHPPNPRFRLQLPVTGFGWVVVPRSWCRPTHECPPCRAECSEPTGWQRGDIRAARDLRRSRRSWNRHESSGGPVLGVSRRTLVDAGAGVTDSSRRRRDRKPIRLGARCG